MEHAVAGNTLHRAGEPAWHRVWLDNYPCDVPSSIPYPRVPVSTLMEMSARRYPDRAGCSLYGQTVTFAKLNRQAHKFARALAALGAGPGQCVGMLLPNIPEYIVALQGTWLTGAIRACSLVRSWLPRKCTSSSRCAIATSLSLSICSRPPF